MCGFWCFAPARAIWAELHEKAFRRLGGATRVVVLDNLREGVLAPDIYDPTLNPLYRDLLAALWRRRLPCRVRDPDRKGKVEVGVGHAKKTPLKGLRFESLEEAQAYLDRWEERWADTRIHGTTKRQVAAMFAEERPALLPLPVEPFRYYQYGERTVHLDGCVEVEAAYYSAPPGWIGRRVHVQWDRSACPADRSADRAVTARASAASSVAGIASTKKDRSTRTPLGRCNCWRAPNKAGPHIGVLCQAMHRQQGQTGRSPHPGRACRSSRSTALARRRRCLRRGAGNRRLRIPLRSPLSGTQSATAAEPAPSRSADPSTHSLSRPH